MVAWGIVFFFRNMILVNKCWVSSFLQQKVGNHSFKTSVTKLKMKILKELRVEKDTKIHGVQRSIGLVLVITE